jgi:hypothetical protein
MGQKSEMNRLQSIGAISAKDGSRWKAGAMKSMTVSQSCGFAWSAQNEPQIHIPSRFIWLDKLRFMR